VDAKVKVSVDFEKFSEITVKPEDFGLELGQDIEPQDISDIQDMVDYIKFSQGVENDLLHGVGLYLNFTELEGLESMQMEVDVPALGLKTAKTLDKKLYQYPEKPENNNNIVFTNTASGGYKFYPGDVSGGKMTFGVNLTPEKPEDKTLYTNFGLLTLRNISPGGNIKVKGVVNLIFDWVEASIKPPEENSNFGGSYPDLDKGEKGIDLSAVAGYKGLNLKEVNAWLFISCPLVGTITLDPSLNFYAHFGKDFVPGSGENLITTKGVVGTEGPKIIADPVKPGGDGDDEETMAIYSGKIPEEGGYFLDLKGVLNSVLSGTNTGELYFEYDIALLGAGQTGIVVTPDIFDEEGKLTVTVDIILELPLSLVAAEQENGGPTQIILEDIDLGSEDLFGRSSASDNSFFDMVSSFEFEISLRNLTGISMGKVKLVNNLGDPDTEYSIPIVDLSKPVQKIAPNIEELKKIYPFIPKVVIEFDSGRSLQIDRGCSIGVNSISVKAGVEQTIKL
jgi:hypothetical protein